MPRRNDPIKSGQCYWVKKPNGKGYNVWSKKVLDLNIARGDITEKDVVYIKVSHLN